MPLVPSLNLIVAFMAICTSTYYVFARAEVTRFLWIRYTGAIDRLARCPACSGWWIGIAISVALGESPQTALQAFVTILLGGAWGMFLTPIGTWALVSALHATEIEEGE